MIDGKSMQKIKDEYQHSVEERADLLSAFEQCEGDMDAVYEEIMCSNVLEDDERLRRIIDEAIGDGQVTAWKQFKRETTAKKRKRIQRAKKEEVEAREYAEELGVADKLFDNGKANGKKKKDDSTGLAALIQQRQKGREDAFFDNLEAKYKGVQQNPGRGRKRTTLDEPPEEAFQKNRKKARA